jgi:hypothetical protein
MDFFYKHFVYINPDFLTYKFGKKMSCELTPTRQTIHDQEIKRKYTRYPSTING